MGLLAEVEDKEPDPVDRRKEKYQGIRTAYPACPNHREKHAEGLGPGQGGDS
jgi:cobalamin-dependent methionine synthase I